MSWRIVTVSSISKLDYKMDYLVVRNQEGIKRVHLSEIAILILESTAISMTAYLLCELNRRKIEVVFCNEKRFPYIQNSLSDYGSFIFGFFLQSESAESWIKLHWTSAWNTKLTCMRFC